MSNLQTVITFEPTTTSVNLRDLAADVGHACTTGPARCNSNETDDMLSTSDLSSVGEELGLDLPLAGDEGNGGLDLDTVLKFFATDKPDSLLTAQKHQFTRRVSGTGLAPWEIHRPQRFVRELAVRQAFSGRVLDAGCGIGDNALYIARACSSARVTAVDVVPRCLDFCAAKASLRGMLGSVTFAAADLTAPLTSSSSAAAPSEPPAPASTPASPRQPAPSPSKPSPAKSSPGPASSATIPSPGPLPEELRSVPYDVVLDSFTFQGLSDADRERYVATLRRLLRPGGVLYLSAVSEEEARQGWFRRVKLSDVQSSFSRAGGWAVELSEPSCIETHPSFWEGSGKTRVYTIRRLAAE